MQGGCTVAAGFASLHPPYDVLARVAVPVVVVIPGRAPWGAQHVRGAGKRAACRAKRAADDRADWAVGCIAARSSGRLTGDGALYRVRVPRRPQRLADPAIKRVARRTGIFRHRRARRSCRHCGDDCKNFELR